jgi:uncharacterized protein (TIGR03792 family)
MNATKPVRCEDAAMPDRALRTFDPPHSVEVMVFEVRSDTVDAWLEADHEIWTLPESERFEFYVDKDVWVSPGTEWTRVTLVITWSDEAAWKAIDPDWVAAQQEFFDEVVGAETYRLVHEEHEVRAHYRVRSFR